MKNFVIALLVGILIGAGGFWYFGQERGSTPAVQEAEKRAGEAAAKAREAGEVVSDAARDAAITAEIKGKLAADPALSAAAIDVDTSGGRVTLTGTAPSHEAIGRATLLALETPGVREVVSTLQVKLPG